MVFSSFKLLGQLNVMAIPQKGSNWCWAACTEMILKYHNPSNTITQCSLATSRKTKQYPSKCCSCIGCDTCSTCNSCSNCSDCHWNNIHVNCDFTITTLVKFKNFLVSLGFNVVTKDNTYSFSKISTEINTNRRPIIAMINSGGNCNSSHAGILRSAFSQGGNKFVVFVNPKFDERMCEAGDEQININGGIYSFCNFLTQIRPQTNGIIAYSTTGMTIKDNSQTKLLQDTLIWEGGLYKTLNNIEFKNLLINDNISYIPVRYLSYDNLLKTSFDSLTVNNTTINAELYEIVSKYSPYVSTTFQLINGKRVPIRLIKLNENPQDFFKQIDIKRKDIDSIGNYNCRLKGYEYIKYPQLAYSFVRFCQNGVYYFVPKGDYRIAKNQLKKGDIYMQSEILKLIKKQIQIDNNMNLNSK